MKIRYIWHDEPNKKKQYDTEVAYKKLPQTNMTLEEWNEHELKSFAEKKQQGLVIDYWLGRNKNGKI